MGCNCGGGGVATAWRAPAAPPSGRRWTVSYPNGVVTPFEQEWQAAQAAALSGGTIDIIEPDAATATDPPGGAATAASGGGG